MNPPSPKKVTVHQDDNVKQNMKDERLQHVLKDVSAVFSQNITGVWQPNLLYSDLCGM